MPIEQQLPISSSPFPPSPPTLETTISTLYFHRFDYSSNFIYVESLSAYLSVTSLFLLSYCAPSSSMLSQMTEISPFRRLNNIPLNVYTTCHLSVDGHLGCFHIWLLWIMLQWTGECRNPFEILISIFGGLHLEIGLLNLMVVLFFFVEETLYCFPYWLHHHFTFQPTVYKSSTFSTSLPIFFPL